MCGRPAPPVSQLGRGRVHQFLAVRGSTCRRVLALVLECAPRRRVQVPASDERVRTRTGLDPRVRRAGRGRRRPRDHLSQYHRGDQPPRVPAKAFGRRCRGHDRGGAPRELAAVGPRCPPALRGVLPRRHVHRGRRHRSARRCTPTEAAGDHRCVERHRVVAAARGDRARGPRAGRARVRRRGTARSPPAVARVRRFRGVERPQDVRAIRRRRARRTARRPSSTAIRSWRAAARSIWSISTRSPGPIRPTGKKQGRRTCSARLRWTRPSVS